MATVHEVIHHGNYYATRDVETESETLTADDMLSILQSCTYISDTGTLPARAARLISDLDIFGKGELGWVTWTVDTVDRARIKGADRGRAAASWVTIDSEENARTFLQMNDDGDPALWDVYGPGTGWLSGEYADSPTPASLAEELGPIGEDIDPDGVMADEVCMAYEEAADSAYIDTLETRARAILEA